MAQAGLLFVVSGPSGVGKSSLCQAIISVVPRACLSVSYSTRKPRPGEQHGREYFFVDEAEFREIIQRQEFVEWASVYHHLYGTPRSQLAQAKSQGMDVVLDIDVQGARQIMTAIDDAVSVFIIPPSLEALRTRLFKRAGDSLEEVERRLEKAHDEMQGYREYDYVIQNDDFQGAMQDLETLIRAERMKSERIDVTWLEENGLLVQGEA